MRPQILFGLFAQLSTLAGVGGRNARLFERLGITRPVDLLWHLPSGLIDRRRVASLTVAPIGSVVTLTLTVRSHNPGGSRRAPYRITCADASDTVDLVYFNAKSDWLTKLAPVGETRVVSGKLEAFRDRLQIVHPDHVVPVESADTIRSLEPQYPLTAGLTPRIFQKIMDQALALVPDLPDWLPADKEDMTGWLDWKAAILAVHAPESFQDIEPQAPARRRLAYDELLANQLALLLVRRTMRSGAGRPFPGTAELVAKATALLPFALTGAQARAIAEIGEDQGAERRMLRLLQGDVGSGKTVVAFLAMLRVIESGGQAAILAPTEILARQHLETIAGLSLKLGIDCRLLTARDKGKARSQALERLASGQLPIIVGTHALLQEDVVFRDLGLVVIDEQHRFGVDQRLGLTRKGRAVDVLVMTATPIPRTLQLAAFGDLDVSRLDEKPPGRQPVRTAALPADREGELIDRVVDQTRQGGQVFWICPLVEDSEELPQLTSATRRFEVLHAVLGDKVGLIHGRMKGAEKDEVMRRFSGGELAVLVSTTVVEVGVDVPQASVIVIEHAERFGLAQLHQLRGRVGRGGESSSCVLLYTPPLGDVARERLKTLRDTDDGFVIAERDLELRGAGEVLGTRQSGLPQTRLAQLDQHADLLALAHRRALAAITDNPELSGPQGEALRVLLYLFDRDAAVRYIRSG